METKIKFDEKFFTFLINKKALPDKTQAEQIGISRSSFLSYKSGAAQPKIETLNRIAAYYCVHPWDLLAEVKENEK